MKATVDRKALADALKAAGKFLPRMAAISALGHYRIEAHSGILAITASNLEAGRRVEVEADVSTEGDVLVPPALAKLVSAGVDASVDLAASDSDLTVSVGRSTASLRLGRLDDYPANIEPDPAGDELEVESWSRVRAVAKLASTEDGRPILQGVLLDAGEAVATDAYSLAHAQVLTSTDHPEIVIPARSILGLAGTPESLRADDRAVKAQLEDGAWWSRLIQGQYVRWRTLIEQQEDAGERTQLRMGTENLLDVLSRCATTIDPTKPVRLELDPESQTLTVSAAEADLGNYTETVPAEIVGKPVEIHFNGPKLRAAVEASASVSIRVADQYKSALVDGDSWWHAAVMPVRMPGS